MKDNYDVTIVLPTKNESANIGNFISSIPEDIKLIIVDDSDDNTTELAKMLRPKNTQIITYKASVSAKRQKGAELAYTTWILFTDADIRFTKSYFKNLKKYLKADLIGGPKLSAGGHELYYRFFSYGQLLLSKLNFPVISASNMIVRRDVLFKIGGFDAQLPCSEDTDLSLRILKSGYKMFWANDLIVLNTDHRRLRKGIIWRYKHIILRTALLYLSQIIKSLRPILYYDWGYWL